MAPRDVHIATVVGGAIIGVSLASFGALSFSASLSSSNTNPGLYALMGAVYSSIGFLFLLVSVVLLPALRAMRQEVPRGP